MLASPGTLPSPAADARWAYETKQDGQRVVAYLPGDGGIVLRARSGHEITGAYPELLPLADALGGTPAVLDGEILALDEQGRARFQLLQPRVGLAHAPGRAARPAAAGPVPLTLFDGMPPERRSPRRAAANFRGSVSPGRRGPPRPHWWGTAPRPCGPPASTGWRAWSASGWTRCTSRGCGPGRGSRSATCAARTSSSAAGCPARDGSRGCRVPSSWVSGRRDGCGTSAGWAPAGARTNGRSWRACCGPPRPTCAPSTRCRRCRARTGW